MGHVENVISMYQSRDETNLYFCITQTLYSDAYQASLGRRHIEFCAANLIRSYEQSTSFCISNSPSQVWFENYVRQRRVNNDCHKSSRIITQLVERLQSYWTCSFLSHCLPQSL